MKNKLHLGCGQRYLEGYWNVDFPPENHTLQKKSVADEYCDITKLLLEDNKLDEIRLHHVFEHFPKVKAFALLLNWRRALKPGGNLVIEVPDLKIQSLFLSLPLLGVKNEFLSSRHLFGSQEAAWANHYEGYTPKMLKVILGYLGFSGITFRRNCWKGTFNFVITAKKSNLEIDPLRAADYIFKMYLVDNTPDEEYLKSVWLCEFSKNLNL